jgi:hypothetical protein
MSGSSPGRRRPPVESLGSKRSSLRLRLRMARVHKRTVQVSSLSHSVLRFLIRLTLAVMPDSSWLTSIMSPLVSRTHAHGIVSRFFVCQNSLFGSDSSFFVCHSSSMRGDITELMTSISGRVS